MRVVQLKSYDDLCIAVVDEFFEYNVESAENVRKTRKVDRGRSFLSRSLIASGGSQVSQENPVKNHNIRNLQKISIAILHLQTLHVGRP